MRRETRTWLKRLTVAQGLALLLLLAVPLVSAVTPEEALQEPGGGDGFPKTSNGFTTPEQFAADKDAFQEVETIARGLGPVYNAQACSECHQNPVSGAGSQITELRAGQFNGTTFTEAAGGSLIQDRAINSIIQEFVSPADNVRALRLSLSILGDGYIEAIADQDILDYRDSQPPALRGRAIQVTLLESPGSTRIGRFGWKDQHASLLSFAADAYVNEMGITSPLKPNENTSNGVSVQAYDGKPDPEDDGEDIEAFTRFMRSTRIPGRVKTTDYPGGTVFVNLGCSVCHRPSYTTAPAGTQLHPGYTVPAALGDKIIYPYSDFLLHDVGTGDGIQLGNKESTRTRMRTPPLWGLRARNRLMHDGASYTIEEAILRHGGEAASIIQSTDPSQYTYKSLSSTDKNNLLAFLAAL